MTSDAFREAWKAEPFRPFRIRLASGRTIEVAHPEFVAISPGQRTVAVFQPDSEGAAVIDLLLVESIDVGPGANGEGGRRRKRGGR